MSIALCMIGRDGIVMSTDRRRVEETQGAKDRTHQDIAVKLHRFNDVGVAFIGDDADYGDYLINRYRDKHLETGFGIDEIVDSFAPFAKANITRYLPPKRVRSNAARLIFLLAGYSSKNKPEMYRLDNMGEMLWFAPNRMPSPCCVGIGQAIAQGWFNKLTVGGMSVEMLKKLSVFLILEVADASDYVSSSMQMGIITKSGFQSITRAEICKLKRDAEEARAKLTSDLAVYLQTATA